MKSYYYITCRMAVKLVLCALVAVIFSVACTRPDKGLEVVVNVSSLIKAPVLLKFSNANKTVTTDIPDFTVTITGKDSALVQMDGGGRDFKVTHGFLPLTLTSQATPSQTNPLTFNVTAKPTGYAPVTRTVEIASDTLNIIELDLVQYTQPPAGTSVLQKTITLNAGVAAATTIKTTVSSTLSQTATISIPDGTKMLDAKGNVINAGSMQCNIVQFGANTPSNLAAFPGGLEAPLALDDKGQPIPGGVKFITAGLLAVNMTANNTQVKSFSKPLSMSIQIPEATDNYNTGNLTKEGDTIPLWSYSEDFGVWSKEGVAVVYKDTEGKLAAKASISHLSYWNLDWYYGTFEGNISINFNPTNSAGWNGYYYVVMQSPNGSTYASTGYQPQYDYYQQEYKYWYSYYWYYWPYYYRYYSWYSFANYTSYGRYGFGMIRLPYVTQAKIVVYDYYNNFQKVGESAVFNPRAGGTVNMNITTPPPPDYVRVYFSVKGNCTSKNIDFLPSGWFYLYDATSYSYTYIYLYNGQVYNYSYDPNGNNGQVSTSGRTIGGSIRLVNGRTYYLQTYTNGKWFSSSFTFKKSNFTIPNTNGLSGTAVYNSATNSTTINGTVTLSCN